MSSEQKKVVLAKNVRNFLVQNELQRQENIAIQMAEL